MAFRNISVHVVGDISGYENALTRAKAMTKQFKTEVQSAVKTAAPQQQTVNFKPTGLKQTQAALDEHKKTLREVVHEHRNMTDSMEQANMRGTYHGKHLASAQLMVRDAMRSSSAEATKLGRAYIFTSDMLKQLVAVSGSFMLIHGFVNMTARAVRFMNDEFLDFNQNMVESMAIMSDSDRMMKKNLEDAANYVSTITQFKPSEAAQGLYFLASAGLSASASIRLLPVAAKFAQAGLMDLDKSTEMMLDITQALSQPPKLVNGKFSYEGTLFDPNNIKRTEEGARRVTDVITQAAIDSNATVEQIGEALMNKLAAQARLVGMTVEETTGMIEVLAMQGIKGRVAGTVSMMALRDIQRTAIKHADKYATIGLKVFDEKGEMLRIDNIVKQFEDKTKNLSDKQRREFFMNLGFQDRALQGILSLLGKGEQMSRAIYRLQTTASGAAERVSNHQMEGLRKAFSHVRNFFARLSQDIGNFLLNAGSRAGQELLPSLKKIVDGGKEVWKAFAPVVKLFGASIGVALISFLKTLAGLMTVVGEAAKRFPSVFAGFLGVLAFKKLTGLTAVTNALDTFASRTHHFATFVNGDGGFISQGFNKIGAAFNGLRKNVAGKPIMWSQIMGMESMKKDPRAMMFTTSAAVDAAVTSAEKQNMAFSTSYENAYKRMAITRKKWSTIFKDGMIPAAQGLRGLDKVPEMFLSALVAPIKTAWEIAKETSRAGIASISSMQFRLPRLDIRQYLDTVRLGVDVMVARTRDAFGRLSESVRSADVKQRLSSFVDPIMQRIGGLRDWLSSVRLSTPKLVFDMSFTQWAKQSAQAHGIVETIANVPSQIASRFKNSNVGTVIRTTLNGIVDAMSSAGTRLAQTFPRLTGWVNALWVQMKADLASQGVASAIGTAVTAIESQVTRAVGVIRGRIAEIMTASKGKFSFDFSGMSESFKSSMGRMRSIASGAWSNISSGFGSLRTKFTTGLANMELMWKAFGKRAKMSFAEAWAAAKDQRKSSWQSFKEGNAAMREASKTAQLSLFKEYTLRGQMDKLMDLSKQKTILLAEYEAMRNANVSAGALETKANQISEIGMKEASVRATMTQVEAETTLAGARRQAAAAGLSTRVPGVSTFGGMLGGALPNIAMGALMILPSIISDFKTRSSEAAQQISETFKDNFNLDLTEIMKGATEQEFDNFTSFYDSQMADLQKDIDGYKLYGWDFDTFTRTWAESLPIVGSIIGTETKDLRAEAKALDETATKIQQAKRKLLNIMTGVIEHPVYKKFFQNKGVGTGVFAGVSIEGMQTQLVRKAREMEIPLNTMENVVKVMESLQGDFDAIQFNLPGVNSADLKQSMEEGTALMEDGTDKAKEAAKAFTDAVESMFSTDGVIEKANAFAEMMRSALATPSDIASSVQDDIDKMMQAGAEAKATSFNKGIESQIKAIEQKKKDINEAASRASKKTKSQHRKDAIDDERDAQIEALDAQKDALTEQKKSQEDFQQTREMSLSELLAGLKKGGDKTSDFNTMLQKLSDSGASEEVIKMFRDMGEKAMPLLKEFTSKGPAEMKKMVDEFNLQVARLGETPKATIGELNKKYSKMQADRRRFMMQMAGLAKNYGFDQDQLKQFVTVTGADAPQLVDFLYQQLSDPATKDQAIADFRELTGNIFDEQNWYTDGFSDAFDQMMSGVLVIAEHKGQAMVDTLASKTDAAGRELLGLLAQFEEAAHTGETYARSTYLKVYGEAAPGTTWTPQDTSTYGVTPGDLPPAKGRKASVPVVKPWIEKYNALPSIGDFNFDTMIRNGSFSKYPKTMEAYNKAKERKMITEQEAKWIYENISKVTNGQRGPKLPVPAYAKGDIVRKPTVGVFAEKGPEVILPLKDRDRMIELLMAALNETGGIPLSKPKNVYNSMFARQRPASHDLIGAGRQGPAATVIKVVPVPVESKTEWNFGDIKGVDMNEAIRFADRKRRERNLVR